MKFRALFISSLCVAQIASAHSWLNDAKHEVRDAARRSLSTTTLHRKLKHTKIAAQDMEPHVVHLRIAIDESLDNGPVLVSVEGDRVKLETEKSTRFVHLPHEIARNADSYTLWYMEQGTHGTDKAYSKVQLPTTLELKK